MLARGAAAAPAAGRDGSRTPSSRLRSPRSIRAFDFEAAERAEMLREHEALQTMLMAHLKNEDEITKKWIALI